MDEMLLKQYTALRGPTLEQLGPALGMPLKEASGHDKL